MFTSTLRPTKKLTRQRQLYDCFVSNRCSFFVDCVAPNLESSVVPLTMIRKIDLVTVFDAILTSRQMREKLEPGFVLF